MPILSRWRGLFRAVPPWLAAALEIIASVTSLRVATMLFNDPTYFSRHQEGFEFLTERLSDRQWVYGLVIGLAAALKMIGVLTSMSSRHEAASDAGFVMRSAGWALSMLFWGAFCISTTLGDPNSLTSIFTGALAVISVIALLGPVMPESVSNGR